MKKILLLFFLFVMPFVFAFKVRAVEYTISPGDDLSSAISRLTSGDILNLNEGTYYQPQQINIRVNGAADNPITIRSTPGQKAIINGGTNYFLTPNQNRWVLEDASIGLYRSDRTFSGNFVGAWLVDYDVQLIEYGSTRTNYINGRGLLETRSRPYSTSLADPSQQAYYQGPGVELHNDYVYIRLDVPENERTNYDGNPINFPLEDTNPNHHKILIHTGNYGNRLINMSGSHYINFENLEFIGDNVLIDTDPRNPIGDISFTGCTFRYNEYGITIRSGSNIRIEGNHFINGFPEYVYWTDIKNGRAEANDAAPEFQSFAVNAVNMDLVFSNNIVERTMDGLLLGINLQLTNLNTSPVQIYNNIFRYHRDDAINLGGGLDANIHHNMFWVTDEAISTVSGGAGTAYVHHNVIDASHWQHVGRPGNHKEGQYNEWSVITPFSSHGGRGGSWRIYNNTILGRAGRHEEIGPYALSAIDNIHLHNNIIYGFGNDVTILDTGIGANFSHNIGWKDDSSTSRIGTDRILNPGFDINAINNPNFSSDIWERYRPSNSQVYGDYYIIDASWPDAEDTNYYGAIGASSSIPTATPTAGPQCHNIEVLINGAASNPSDQIQIGDQLQFVCQTSVLPNQKKVMFALYEPGSCIANVSILNEGVNGASSSGYTVNIAGDFVVQCAVCDNDGQNCDFENYLPSGC